jgi:hypothetical protein
LIKDPPSAGKTTEEEVWMIKAIFHTRRIAVLLTVLGAVGAIAVFTTATASAHGHTYGRTIEGNFCLKQHLFCMSAGLDGQTPAEGYGVDGNAGACVPPAQATTDPPAGPQYCVPSETGFLRLRPGTYWIAVNDDQNNHNFSLRSCPRSMLPCTASNPDETSEQPITDIASVYTAPVTIKVNLKPGWYRLFCDSDMPVVHEKAGMYVDLEVVGVLGLLGG